MIPFFEKHRCLYDVRKEIKTNNNHFYFLYKKCYTLGYVDSIRAYQIVLHETTAKLNIQRLNINIYIRSIKIHITADGTFVISVRDLN